MSLALTDFSPENGVEFDVVVSDYKLDQIKNYLQNTKLQKNKIKDIEKILISEKEFELLPKNNIYLKRPFRFIELVEVLYSIFDKLKSKRENKMNVGCIATP